MARRKKRKCTLCAHSIRAGGWAEVKHYGRKAKDIILAPANWAGRKLVRGVYKTIRRGY